ncbi:hypothetical protein [Deinococcus frigens]|uniref:hypothetical protein n=1 Tax=Deinococcus frigens TaxID=249403 RepID=UPI0012EC4A59|nr:hypothetical protein [Deinococcus frigens]
MEWDFTGETRPIDSAGKAGNYIRIFLILAGNLSAIWVTFIHPPLILVGGGGSTVNARARCEVIGDDFRKSSQFTQSPVDEWDFGVSESEEQEAQKWTRDCLRLATVNVPNVFLQIFVIAAITWILMSFTRTIK